MKTLRIFISSPGDVAEEREKAKQVISSLQREVGGDVVLMPVLWEDLAIPATASFQEGIDFVLSEKHRIDIAVFVLWSRLGSPLGACITKPDGSAYRSGTEREFDLMLSAFEQSGRKMPIILAYTRDDLGAFSDKLDARTQQEDALEELLRQRKLVKQFIHERFHDEQGRNLRAYHTYREPVGFAQRLHVHLREAIHDLLGRNYAGTRWEGSPYRSLDVFDVKHAPIFFGRDQEICDVLQRLRDQQSAGCAFVCIVGASGSGKSSLARAGVAGTLIQRSFEDGVREWRAAALIPGLKQGDLYRGLTRCLAEMLPELRTGVGGLEKLYDCFREQNHAAAGILIATAFAAATAKAGGALRVLVVLDQMEELWTDGSISPEQREGFLEALESLAGADGISVLATLRSDFYPQAQLSGAFLRMKGERGHFDLTPPGPAALHQLIVQPAHCAGLVFEREEPSGRTLDQQILADAMRDPSALPLLQYALAELHELRDEPKRQLTFEAYKDMGGVEGALGKRAAQTFDSLPTDVQAALYELLPLLVSVDVGGDQNAVRRRAPLEELLATPARRSLTEALIEARFLTTDSEGDEKKPVVGLAHEALLRRWDKLKEWTDRNGELLRLRGTVEQGETRWKQTKRHQSLLLTPGLPLEEGRRLLRDGGHLLKADTREYLEISIAQFEADEVRRKADEERRLKMRRAAVVALSVLTLLALGAAVWALRQQSAAELASKTAEEEKIRAEDALVETQIQLERSQLEEGRAWLERAKLAWESEKDPVKALMLAGRAVGFHGYGRTANESDAIGKEFRSLLGERMSDPEHEADRRVERNAVDELVKAIRPTGLPIWSSPVRVHHSENVTSVAFSPDGSRLASGSDDNTVKLWDVARWKELATLQGHSAEVTSVAFSPDVSRLASGSVDKTVKLWDVASGKELASLQGHEDSVRSVAFSPDGSRLASGSSDKTVKLWDVASGKEVATLDGHSRDVTSVAFSPDGRLLASGAVDRTVKLWDVASGKEVATLQGHSWAVTCVAFSPDGSRLASGAVDKTVKLWDAASGKELATLHGHSEGVTSVAFSPDGSRLASGSGDQTVKLWDVATGKDLATLEGHSEDVKSVAFSPDGSRLASGSGDQTVKLWDVASGKDLATLEGHSKDVKSVAFSPDGRRLASGSEDKTVKLWDVATGKDLATLEGHSKDVKSVAFSPDGSRLASGSWDKTVKLWDAASGKELATLEGHSDTVTSVAFSPDGSRLASGSWDKTVKLWDVVSGKELATLQGHSYKVTSVAFSPDGTRLASGVGRGLGDGTVVKLWDMASGKELAALQGGYYDYVTSVAFSPDGSRLAAGAGHHTGDGTVKLWKVATGEELAPLHGHSDTVTSVAFSPDGSRLVSGSLDQTLKLWDVASGKELATLHGHSEGVTSVAFSPDGLRLASGDDTVNLWDVASSKELATLQGHSLDVSSVAFSPDGSRLASGSWDGRVKLWDVASGKELATLQGHLDGVTSVAFSPDGNRLASGSQDDTVKLWDVANGKDLATLEGHSKDVKSVAFSPDGRRLASGSEDKTVKLWDVATGKELATLQGHSGYVTSVAFSPDGSRLASRSEDHMKLWDVASEKELAEAPDFPVSAGSSTFAPDGTLEAVMEGTRVFLRPASGTEDLTRFLRGRYFSLPDREVVWGLNDSLLSARSFPVLHPRPDLVAQLAESSLSPAQRLAIRAQLCGICGAWRRLPPLWQEVQDAGLNRDPGLRPVLALQFAIAARFLAVPNKPVFPRELWEPLRDLIDPEAFSNPSFSLAMARLVPGYLRADEVSFESKAAMVETVLKINPDAFSNPSFSLAMTQLMPVFLGADEVSSESKAAMIETVLKICPVPWLTAVVQRIVAEKGEDRPALSPMASAFVRRSSERHPGSSELLRAALASYLQTDAAHTPLENRLLALPDAEGGDFTAAAYAAAKRGETDRARTLLEQARSRFSKDESVHRMAGWSYLNLNDFDAALTAFEAAKARVEEGQRPDTDLLAGLSIAQWLSGEQQAAVESYRELIEAGRKKEEPTDWADASTVEALTWPNSEKVPLEAVRAATLEKHPELTPKNEDTKE